MPVDDIRASVRDGDLPAVSRRLDGLPAHEVADLLARLDESSAGLVFRMLGKDEALAAFEDLDPVSQHGLLRGMRDGAVGELVERMEPDDRARMLGEVPASVANRVLAGLSPGEREMTASLLGYPARSAGRSMSPELVSLHSDDTVARALDRVRRDGASAETVYTLPIVDEGRCYAGVVTLRRLVLGDPGATVGELADPSAPWVLATDPAEDAAHLMRETDVLALPVLDAEHRLLGLITIDDAVDVLEQAQTEDTARQAGAAPWAGHYMAQRVWPLARSRVVWLLLLLVAATLTVNVLQFFEDTLETVTALALFVPLLIGTGGNAGAQAATASVRAVAVGEVRPSDVLAVAWREARVGIALGAMLAVAALGIGSALVGVRIAVVVAISLVAICAWAATIGATMPLVAKRLGIDPAVVSAPAVTTLVDATGLIIYFVVARAVLGI